MSRERDPDGPPLERERGADPVSDVEVVRVRVLGEPGGLCLLGRKEALLPARDFKQLPGRFAMGSRYEHNTATFLSIVQRAPA